MSLNFKTDLKEMRENDPAGEDALDGDYKASENYDTPSHVRNLCFVWPDGRMKFMNYAYLVSGEYSSVESSIVLAYTTETLVIKGVAIEGLFTELLEHFPRIIKITNTRYQLLQNSIITDVIIK